MRAEWMKVNELLAKKFSQQGSFFEHDIPTADELTPFEVDAEVLGNYLQCLIAKLAGGKYTEHRQLLAQAGMLITAEQTLWSQLDPASRSKLMDWV